MPCHWNFRERWARHLWNKLFYLYSSNCMFYWRSSFSYPRDKYVWHWLGDPLGISHIQSEVCRALRICFECQSSLRNGEQGKNCKLGEKKAFECYFCLEVKQADFEVRSWFHNLFSFFSASNFFEPQFLTSIERIIIPILRIPGDSIKQFMRSP